jgi:hypothetical protein
VVSRFGSNEEFEAWFEVHKAATRTSFTQDQSWSSEEGEHVIWRCDRSARRGSSALAPVVRPDRGKPSTKCQSACTCTVQTITHDDASVFVSVICLHTHWRGANDLRNSSVSPDTKSFVANLVSIGLSDKSIMRLNQADVLTWERRDEFDSCVTRDILLTQQVPPQLPFSISFMVHSHSHLLAFRITIALPSFYIFKKPQVLTHHVPCSP